MKKHEEKLGELEFYTMVINKSMIRDHKKLDMSISEENIIEERVGKDIIERVDFLIKLKKRKRLYERKIEQGYATLRDKINLMEINIILEDRVEEPYDMCALAIMDFNEKKWQKIMED